jgi:nitrous oxide reductase accessory protein NosL
MLKKSLIIVFIGFISLYGTVFSKKATVTPKLIQQENGNQWCPVSGEKIEDFYKTSYTAKLQMNGNNRQYCSMRCLVMDMDEYGIDLNSVQVLDVTAQKYIQAQDAYYVVGSEVDGSLSQKSKLAFKSKKDAQEFIKKYKGTLKNFKETLELAKNSLKKDNEILKKIKKKKTYPRGKRIFEKVCQKDLIDPTSYIEINELKQDIVDQKLCKPLKEKDLQAVALYIWEVKRFGDLDTIEDKVQVKEDEKCPVCGMYTYKYPRWAAQIFYEKQDDKKHWSFDGVKDMMKFYFDSQKWGNYEIAKRENITKILVTDYYSQKGIDGTKAYYVIRSDIYGPMGHELIPFESLSDAETFKKDHFGKKIIQFSDIIEDEVYQLDFNE